MTCLNESLPCFTVYWRQHSPLRLLGQGRRLHSIDGSMRKVLRTGQTGPLRAASPSSWALLQALTRQYLLGAHHHSQRARRTRSSIQPSKSCSQPMALRCSTLAVVLNALPN